MTPEDTSRAACKFLLLYIVHLLGLLFFKKKKKFQLFFLNLKNISLCTVKAGAGREGSRFLGVRGRL